jgi:hypothetical protein
MTNLVTGAAYAGAIGTLTTCSDVDQESDGEAWCASNVEYTRYQLMRNGVPVTPAVVYWVNDITGVSSNVMPVGATKGKCVISNAVTITGTALAQIAGSGRVASDPNFSGQPNQVDTTTITGSGNLISITVSAKGITDGQSSLNRVEITMPDGTIAYMFNGETKEVNLSRGQETALRREYIITAYGNAYANIHGSYE